MQAIIANGSPEEIAALVQKTRERQTEEDFVPMDAIKEAARKAIGDTAGASQDSSLPLFDK